ncbi:BZIP domain-containing protein [Caenorhabditis elegans]|uniref:BZIP domain-containing protein n=1 Tax=Caenorhabditis elegans TaxID=6239 RepID=M1Z844_CAEEL|nr:BZIP domain-containing protein [Caenorhabditis elegans]CCU83316.1 BZIP domain-containing protein [Caenorhabditis elegans]|eukprot:NP_001293523.1 Uncharacterized protein CELE_Y17G7B.21 [Caenorhabditis elegans]
MSSAQVYEIVVEYADNHCSTIPSTSSSVSPRTSGATSPTSSTSSSSTGSARRVRRLSKTKKSATFRRSTARKLFNVGKKYAKRFATSTSSAASKLRLVKLKIDKKYQQRLAESKARVERFQREREELLAGNSQVAILTLALQKV